MQNLVGRSVAQMCVNATVKFPTKIASRCYSLTNFEKKILVWTKKYPSIDQIPADVPSSVLSKAKDKFRWKMAVIAMGLTVAGSVWFVILGKRDAARGDTVHNRSMQWHEELRPGSTKPII